MSETLETTARCQRFLAEQSAAWSDVAVLTESLREAFTKQPESLLGDGSFQDGIRRMGDISRSLYSEVFAQGRPRMRFVVRMIEPALRILLWFAALLFAVSLLAPTKDAFLAALGSAAIAIGLGAQDLIKNLIGGFVIVADRPYQTGDRVLIGDAYGEIERIGLRSTKLMTPDDTLVTIPNSKILDVLSFNENAGVAECMVVMEVFLPADSDPDLVISIGREALLTCPYLRLDRRHAVSLRDGYSESPYLTLRMKGYVYDHRYQPAMQTDVIRRCKSEFRRLGLLEGWKATRA